MPVTFAFAAGVVTETVGGVVSGTGFATVNVTESRGSRLPAASRAVAVIV